MARKTVSSNAPAKIPSTAPPREPAPSSSARRGAGDAATPDAAWLRRLHFVARLSRAWDNRFESMARAGQIGRWYSAVGNEVTTVGAALQMRPGDALSTVHRDLGAVLATYLDVTRLAPELFPADDHTAWDARRGDPREYLYRLACQLLGRRDGFTQGVDRSFHYGLLDDAQGIRHVGMISHLGAMLPVAAGLALASLQDRAEARPESLAVVLAFTGEGATSQGDFHETLNTAGVMKLPLVLVIENNRYAFSTPVDEQYACDTLSSRAAGYGIAGVTVDGTDVGAVHDAMARAFARARAGDGATLVEALLPRMRGHAEGDGSYEVIPEDLRREYLTRDPLPRLERTMTERGLLDPTRAAAAERVALALVDAAFERASACPEPDESVAMRPMYAPGAIADAAAREAARG
jgi:2-oxoisovalerate dehydrogenase E1 component